MAHATECKHRAGRERTTSIAWVCSQDCRTVAAYLASALMPMHVLQGSNTPDVTKELLLDASGLRGMPGISLRCSTSRGMC